MGDDDRRPRRSSNFLAGVGGAIGSGAGAAVAASTGEPFWVGVGAGIGVALGMLIAERRGRSE